MSFFTSIAGEGSEKEPILNAKNKIDGVGSSSNTTLTRLENDVKNGKIHIYLFIYWRDCGHCKRSYGDWEKFEKLVISKNKSGAKVAVYAIEQDGLSGMSGELLGNIGGSPDGFPTIRHVLNNTADDYAGERDIKAFTEWMNKTSGNVQAGGCSCGISGGRKKGEKKNIIRRRSNKCELCRSRKGNIRRTKNIRSISRKKSRRTNLKNARVQKTRRKTRRV